MLHPFYQVIYGDWKEEMSGTLFIFENIKSKVYVIQRNFSSFVCCEFKISSEENKNFLIIGSEKLNIIEIVNEKQCKMTLHTEDGKKVTLIKLHYPLV